MSRRRRSLLGCLGNISSVERGWGECLTPSSPSRPSVMVKGDPFCRFDFLRVCNRPRDSETTRLEPGLWPTADMLQAPSRHITRDLSRVEDEPSTSVGAAPVKLNSKARMPSPEARRVWSCRWDWWMPPLVSRTTCSPKTLESYLSSRMILLLGFRYPSSNGQNDEDDDESGGDGDHDGHGGPCDVRGSGGCGHGWDSISHSQKSQFVVLLLAIRRSGTRRSGDYAIRYIPSRKRDISSRGGRGGGRGSPATSRHESAKYKTQNCRRTQYFGHKSA